MSDTKYVGCDTWRNLRTGEERRVDEYMKSIGRKDPFYITYMIEILRLFDSIGGQKMKVIKFILENMSKNDNTLKFTRREISKLVPASRNTVDATIKLLAQADLIKYKRGLIMISPRFMNNWQAQKEANMLVQFKEFN